MQPSSIPKDDKACQGCGELIKEKSILKSSDNSCWHSFCLRCFVCKKILYKGDGKNNGDEKNTCFMKDGKPFCKMDYEREYSVRCSGCQMVLHSNDLVMKTTTKIYHTYCFRCRICWKLLLPGTQFKLDRNEAIICYEHARSSPWLNSLRNAVDIKNPKLEDAQSIQETKAKASRQRMRTVLTEKQLATLKACYSANPRPDANMKEKLVELTGLPARVIRVWFQNKRCKDKKRSLTGLWRESDSPDDFNFPRQSSASCYERSNPFIHSATTEYAWFHQLGSYMNSI